MSPNEGDREWRIEVEESPPPVNLDEDDMEELKKVIMYLLAKYDALYEKRIQKLIFYGEIFTAQKTGQRLTDSSFAPYDYGPYTVAITKALEELEEEGRIDQTSIGQYEAKSDGSGLSPKKRYLIDQIHEKTKRMSTDELVDRAKDTWLWRNFEYAEEVDFAKYIDEVIIPPEIQHYVGGLERDTVDDNDIDRLLTE